MSSGFGAGQSRGVGRRFSPRSAPCLSRQEVLSDIPGYDFPQALPVRDGQELQVLQELFAHG